MSTDDTRAPGRGAEDGRQREVDEVFDASAPYWRDVYQSGDFQSRVYQRRRDRALAWASTLVDGRDTRALEVGCGAGLLTIGLAEQGYVVDAVDTSNAMLRQAREMIESRHLEQRVTLRAADAHALPWDDETFDLVVALGVVPWLHSPSAGLAEMARVTRRGGHVLVSADNSLGLSNLLEPRLSAAAAPFRRAIGAALRGLHLRGPSGLGERRYRPRRVDRMLAAAGLVKLRSMTVGFGRFTFFGLRLLSENRSLVVDDGLQRFADRDNLVVRNRGNHYLVLAERP